MKRLNMNITDEQMLILKLVHSYYGFSISSIVSDAIDDWIGNNVCEKKFDVLKDLEKVYSKKAKGLLNEQRRIK